MFRLLTSLVGFALFGALFAGLYYQPSDVERDIGTPKFRLAPGEIKPDFIEPVGLGENVTVNITVLRGGPIDVFLMDMENLTEYVLNSTEYGFDDPDDAIYDRRVSASNVTAAHNFTFIADGENRWAVVLRSNQDPHPDPDNATNEELEAHVTEVAVSMRYIDRETKSLVFGYLLAIPSVALIVVTLWLKMRRGRRPPSDEPAYVLPRDEGL